MTMFDADERANNGYNADDEALEQPFEVTDIAVGASETAGVVLSSAVAGNAAAAAAAAATTTAADVTIAAGSSSQQGDVFLLQSPSINRRCSSIALVSCDQHPGHQAADDVSTPAVCYPPRGSHIWTCPTQYSLTPDDADEEYDDARFRAGCAVYDDEGEGRNRSQKMAAESIAAVATAAASAVST